MKRKLLRSILFYVKPYSGNYVQGSTKTHAQASEFRLMCGALSTESLCGPYEICPAYRSLRFCSGPKGRPGSGWSWSRCCRYLLHACSRRKHRPTCWHTATGCSKPLLYRCLMGLLASSMGSSQKDVLLVCRHQPIGASRSPFREFSANGARGPPRRDHETTSSLCGYVEHKAS